MGQSLVVLSAFLYRAAHPQSSSPTFADISLGSQSSETSPISTGKHDSENTKARKLETQAHLILPICSAMLLLQHKESNGLPYLTTDNCQIVMIQYKIESKLR